MGTATLNHAPCSGFQQSWLKIQECIMSVFACPKLWTPVCSSGTISCVMNGQHVEENSLLKPNMSSSDKLNLSDCFCAGERVSWQLALFGADIRKA